MGEREDKRRPEIKGDEGPSGDQEDNPVRSETHHRPPDPTAGAEERRRANESRLGEVRFSLKKEAEPKPPIVFVGGFTTPESAYTDEIRHLESQGYTVHYINPDEGEDLTPEEKAYFNRLNADTQRPVPELVQRKGAAIRAFIDRNGIENPTIISQSQGGAAAVSYEASNEGRHENVRTTLVLDNPGGLMGEDTPAQLISRARRTQASTKKRAKERDRTKQTLKEFKIPSIVNFIKRPWFRVRHEIPSLAGVDITDMLRDIHERGDTEVVLLTAHSDQTYPRERVESSLGEMPFADLIDRWASYREKDAEHNAPIVERAGVLQQVIEERPAATDEN